MTKSEVMTLLKKAVETWNRELAREAAEEALRLNIDPLEAIENGLGKGMNSISKRFNEGKIFLPQVLAASQAMEEGMKVFEPYLFRGTCRSRAPSS